MRVVSVVDWAMHMLVAMVMAMVMAVLMAVLVLVAVLVLQDVCALGCGCLHSPRNVLRHTDLWIHNDGNNQAANVVRYCACQQAVDSLRPNGLCSAVSTQTDTTGDGLPVAVESQV
jgi:hypothetical protein